MNAFIRALILSLFPVILGPVLRADSLLVPRQVAFGYMSTVELTWMVTNSGSEPVRFAPSEKIPARLHSGTALTRDVELVRQGDGSPVQVSPGGFARAVYWLALPAGVAGPIVLDASSIGAEPVMFSVTAQEQAKVASLPATEPSQVVKRETALRRSTHLLSGLSPYEPVYFGMGATGGLNAKFQVSLKYNPFDTVPLYMGYTQTSLWDLHSTSKPFRDTAYRPSLFYYNPSLWETEGGRFRFGSQLGFEHESNGKGGDDSRSINIGFVRPRFEWNLSTDKGSQQSLGKATDTILIVSPKLYGYIEKSENSDIIDYRGCTDLMIGLVHKDYRISATLRKGLQKHYGSVQVDLVFPLRASDDFLARFRAHGMNGYFFIQYFNGWGESILDYQRKLPAQFRAGLLVVP